MRPRRSKGGSPPPEKKCAIGKSTITWLSMTAFRELSGRFAPSSRRPVRGARFRRTWLKRFARRLEESVNEFSAEHRKQVSLHSRIGKEGPPTASGSETLDPVAEQEGYENCSGGSCCRPCSNRGP